MVERIPRRIGASKITDTTLEHGSLSDNVIYISSSAPTAGDDTYAVGTIWVDYTNGATYTCTATGSENASLSYYALSALTTGQYNVAAGRGALQTGTTFLGNVGLGDYALQSCTANYNTAVGYRTLYYNTSGADNSAVGRLAGFNVTTGYDNTIMGAVAMQNATTGHSNAAFGYNALNDLTTSIQCTAVGANALASVTTGSYNTALGYGAGSSQTTGVDNVYIGRQCGENVGTNGEVMIYYGTNTARFQGSGTSWSITSDGRDKTDYQDLGLGIEFLKKIKPRQFKWDWREGSKEGNGTIRAGFIAQEVLEACDSEGLSRTPEDSITSNKVYPGVVDITNPDKYQVAAGDFVPMLVKAVQELSAEVEQLKSQINN